MIRTAFAAVGGNTATAYYTSLGAELEDHFTGRILIGAAYDTLAAEAET